jgi:selenoprotein W-related protein
LKAEIEKHVSGVHVELIESSGGVFEVKKDDRLIFSKKKTGRFPEPEEVFQHLK